MNKKLVTLAVAAAMAAPAVAMADATMYGILNQSIDYFDVSPSDLQKLEQAATGVPAKTFKGWTLDRGQDGKGAPRSNRIGIKGSEDLGGGLKAIYQVEFGVTLADERGSSIDGDNTSVRTGNGQGPIYMRNSFVGLAGGWGTFLVGRHDTPYKISTGKLDLFADTVADYNGTVRFFDTRADNAIAYISPSFSGFQFAGAVIPGGGHTVSGYDNIDSDSIAEGYSLAAIYSNGPWYASAAYESFNSDLGTNEVEVGTDGDLFADSMMLTPGGLAPVSGYVEVMNPDGTPSGTYEPAPGVDTVKVSDGDWNKWRFGLGILDWNGFYLTGIYANWDNGPDARGIFINDNSRDLWQVQAGYAFGNNMIKAMYGQMDRDTNAYKAATSVGAVRRYINDADRSTWGVGFDHNFSKRTQVYAVYTDVDDKAADEQDWSAFSMGVAHKF